MRIVCLGNAAQDVIDSANRKYALTSSTSQKMLDFFNQNGGNVADTAPTVAKKSEPSFFDKAWGILEKLGTIASTEPTPQKVVVESQSTPILAIAGVGLVAYILLKAVK